MRTVSASQSRKMFYKNPTKSNQKFKGENFMNKCEMKNVVILKNLPSNLIEEAFVVVKSKKVAKSLKYIDSKSKSNQEKSDNYIIREAESVLSSYVKQVEKKEVKIDDSVWKKKYKVAIIFNLIISIGFLISVIA